MSKSGFIRAMCFPANAVRRLRPGQRRLLLSQLTSVSRVASAAATVARSAADHAVIVPRANGVHAVIVPRVEIEARAAIDRRASALHVAIDHRVNVRLDRRARRSLSR